LLTIASWDIVLVTNLSLACRKESTDFIVRNTCFVSDDKIKNCKKNKMLLHVAQQILLASFIIKKNCTMHGDGA